MNGFQLSVVRQTYRSRGLKCQGCMLLKGSMSNIRLDGCQVRYAVNIKYLGIRFSERMRCKEHLFEMKAKIMNAFVV